jgi:hypothetical protein
MAPSSVGGTSRRLRPKLPMAVLAAELITTLVTGFLSLGSSRTDRKERRCLLSRRVRVSDLLERVVDLAEDRGGATTFPAGSNTEHEKRPQVTSRKRQGRRRKRASSPVDR